MPPGLVVGLIAGGDNAIRRAVEKAEDDLEQGWLDLQQHQVSDKDVVVGIAASGTTPYVVGALRHAASVGAATGLISANPSSWFGREVAPTWWSWPALVVSSVLGGLLVALSVGPSVSLAAADRRGVWGAVGTFFAVGCPVCNKVVLLALGSAGAMTWFAPVQPLLALASIALLTWAVARRLRSRDACAIPQPAGSRR